MSRIKCRCWNSQSKTMYYDINLMGGHACKDGHWLCYTEEDAIMQYSWLKDCKGQEEICEDDILEGEAPTGVVKFGVFDNKEGGPEHACGVGFYLETRDGISSLSELLIDVYKYKIIGNVHENKNLLKKVKM